MKALAGRKLNPVAAIAAVIGIAAVVWLAPLMSDQLVFFGDREQNRQAEAARSAMLPAAAILIAAAAGLLTQHRPLHALLAALPALVAVPLALASPATGYQLLAYAILGPIALGALASAAIGIPRSARGVPEEDRALRRGSPSALD